MNWSIRLARNSDALALAPRLRPMDRLEVEVVSGAPVELSLLSAVADSTLAWATILRNEVAMLFGVGAWPGHRGVGIPWLLGADVFDELRVPFLRESRRYISTMQLLYPRLINYVHADNRAAIRWLRWSGFRFGRPVLVRGHPFIEFTRGSE